MQYSEMILYSVSKRAEKYLKFYMDKMIIIPDGNNEVCYFEEQEQKQFMKSIIDYYSSNLKDMNKCFDMVLGFGKEYETFAKQIYDSDVKKMDNLDLLSIYEAFYEWLTVYQIPLFLVFLLNEYWSEKLNDELDTDDDLVRQALFRPSKKSTVIKMQEEVMNLKEEDVESFWNKYKWIPCLDIQYNPWTLDDVKEYVSNIAEMSVKRMGFAEAVKKAGLKSSQVEQFKMMKELGYMKDVRDDYRRRAMFYLLPFFDEVAGRMGISRKEFAYLTGKEVEKFLKIGVFDKSVIDERSNGFMLTLENDNIRCFSGKDISIELEKIGFVEDKVDIGSIKGIVANKGKVKGTAKVVRTVHDILKIEKGDIMVAVTTHPDFVPAMQKAAAIVTDEGGLLCHAAIVSRELGKPCVVGTKIATKTISNGSQVEVDNGIIRIIK